MKKYIPNFFHFVGDSPSNIQFYITDMSDKFINGSLFFDAKPNYDSLFPYIDYVRNDIKKWLTLLIGLMNNYNQKWVLLAILSIIWGSSFILIKKGLIGLSPVHLGSLRIIFTTIVILVFFI